MSLTGRLSPLNVNTLSSLVQNIGLGINNTATQIMGTRTSVSTETVPGSIYNDTVLIHPKNITRYAYTHSHSAYGTILLIGSNSIPVLGLSKPSTYTNTYTGERTSYGFLKLIPLLAHNELYVKGGTLSLSDFVSTFNTCMSFKNTMNQAISSLNDSTTFLEGVYSNMDDLVSSDITGVSLSTFHWGQDLIATGRVIDLNTIDTFGNPDNLLKSLYKNKAMTKSVNLALLTSGLDATTINDILNGNQVTFENQKAIYNAFNLILGVDLKDTLIAINCQTPNLDTLADLLDIKKLFPNSYSTLTVPVYNGFPNPTNSKTYYPIYVDGGVNTQVLNQYGASLRNTIPENIASACEAFRASMLQIKNIKSANIEKFSQVVTHMENVSNLGVNNTSKPTNESLINGALPLMAKGSGDKGLYLMTDFFGSMTNIKYEWEELKNLVALLQTSTLTNLYIGMYNKIQDPVDSNVNSYITQINTEIENIYNTNRVLADRVNTLYKKFGTLLTKEENARNLALTNLTDLQSSSFDIIGFMNNIGQLAQQTEKYGPAEVLESISNTATIGGNSMIGSLREARNAHRLGLAGLEQDNDVQQENLNLPPVTGTVVVDRGPLAYVPAITGAATTKGSLAGSPYTALIPNHLNLFQISNVVSNSILSPEEAVAQVIKCNCDCWD
jgi:hypothetical protein